LIASQDRELRGGTLPGGEGTESLESSSSPLSYPQGIQAKDATKSPPKERRRAYPPIAKVASLMRSQVLRMGVCKYAGRRKKKMPRPMKHTPAVLDIEGFFSTKVEPL